jgi:hypothetical protein
LIACRNEIERPFLRLIVEAGKDAVDAHPRNTQELEVVFLAFISFALIVEGLRWC